MPRRHEVEDPSPEVRMRGMAQHGLSECLTPT
eukprot:CAMPEP_0184720434 /NCGR_PEP_ID=MMETSP0314-20130426/13019_1 /TAXON_ID=38298 /ORGANISM="Rhodella maculata, Strain CCMP 736" /LENGTH=31 /DNA_ID= /DNA_START= /DNA_END= /DNA_ORIENTATION=